MTVKEFFDLCALKGCDGVVIVNELADDFTHGNVIDIIDHEPVILNFRHTFHDFQNESNWQALCKPCHDRKT